MFIAKLWGNWYGTSQPHTQSYGMVWSFAFAGKLPWEFLLIIQVDTCPRRSRFSGQKTHNRSQSSFSPCHFLLKIKLWLMSRFRLGIFEWSLEWRSWHNALGNNFVEQILLVFRWTTFLPHGLASHCDDLAYECSWDYITHTIKLFQHC